MLVLGRKENESILIGDNIRVTIVGRAGSSIRVGVQAPSHVRIVREELARASSGGAGDNGTHSCCLGPLPRRGSPDELNRQSADGHVVLASIGTQPTPKQAG